MTVSHTSPGYRTRLGAIAFAVAGVLFAAYEAAAPRTDQTTLDGAASWASAAWSIAHISAIVGLILIPLGYGAIRGFLERTPHERTAFLAATIGYIGSGLTISYYGAEVYGLKAIGRRAVADGDASLTDVGNDFRFDPTAMTVFAIGLLLIAIAAVLAAIAVWRSRLFSSPCSPSTSCRTRCGSSGACSLPLRLCGSPRHSGGRGGPEPAHGAGRSSCGDLDVCPLGRVTGFQHGWGQYQAWVGRFAGQGVWVGCHVPDLSGFQQRCGFRGDTCP